MWRHPLQHTQVCAPTASVPPSNSNIIMLQKDPPQSQDLSSKQFCIMTPFKQRLGDRRTLGMPFSLFISPKVAQAWTWKYIKYLVIVLDRYLIIYLFVFAQSPVKHKDHKRVKQNLSLSLVSVSLSITRLQEKYGFNHSLWHTSLFYVWRSSGKKKKQKVERTG